MSQKPRTIRPLTINAALKDHVNKQGQRQVYIRITQNKKHSWIRIENVAVKKAEWTGRYGEWVNRKNKNHEKLNVTILGQLTAYKNQYLDLKKVSPIVSKELIYDSIIKENFTHNFIEYWDLKTSLKAMPEYNQRKGYLTTRRKIVEYAGTESIDFREITESWLRDFETHLFESGLSDDSVETQQKRIRAIWNKAIDKDKIISKALYPFGKGGYKLPKVEEGTVERLDISEIKEILKLKYDPNLQIFYAHAAFILSFRCAGIRAEDLLTLKWSNIKGGRLIFLMKKGVSKGKICNYEITEKIKLLLDDIKAGGLKSGDYIFPFLKPGTEELCNEDYKKAISSKTTLLNKWLAKVAEDACLDKRLKSHLARHSWAAYAYEETKDIKFVQEKLNHSNTKITEGYIGRLGISASDTKMRAIEV